MSVYLDLVVILNFLVDLLLLMGTNRLAGYGPGIARASLASLLGGAYAGACLLPGFRFLGNLLWRLIFLTLMALIAFGPRKSALRRGVLFLLLSMALGGVAQAMGSGSFGALSAAALGVCLLCVLGFQGRAAGQEYVDVQLRYHDREIRLTALRDTGNTLRDPVTGQQVLVADAAAAMALLGLTVQQLRSPVETLAGSGIPGLRLIPYRAVGQSAGMLLAVRCQQIRIGKACGSGLVAFSPDALSSTGEYQALTGGAI